MQTLRDVSVELSALIARYNSTDITDEERLAIELQLDTLDIDFKEKIRQILDLREYYDSEAKRSKAEADRMQERADRFANKANRIQEYVDRSMRIYNVDKIDTGYHKVSYRASQAVIITDPSIIPQELCKHVPEKWEPSKTLIGDAIKAGQVVDGAYVEKRKNLQIK